MSRHPVLLFTLAIAVSAAAAQTCPREKPNNLPDAEIRTLHGRVIIHNGLRYWIELKPDRPICGHASVWLIDASSKVDDSEKIAFEAMRDCTVTVSGRLGLSPTGYSTPMYMSVDRKQPDQNCVLQSTVPITYGEAFTQVNRYRVHMIIDYNGEGSVTATATAGSRLLQPWYAYAPYFILGDPVIRIRCAAGHNVSHISVTRGSQPFVADNYININLESAAQKGIWKTHVDYTCSR